ncbi:hypothetical protein [Aeromicrobium sp. REDSEA-S32_B7]|uniref:hypothetical protein n=1 Tax=Aeromicrobium sp. REDSEA-S32_B7 TaxID=1811526 RepID=UPI0034DB353D
MEGRRAALPRGRRPARPPHLVRVPDGNRIELRGGDGSANPYLAAAGAIGAVLDGVERRLDPGAPGGSDDADRAPLPLTLLHAVEALEADPAVSGVLDSVGPDVARYFADLKREEFFTWHSQVSAWEVDHYLTAF